MKFKCYNLGCKVNLYEIEAISSSLINEGFELVNQTSNAEIIIINTCTVTQNSDHKSYRLIKQLRKNHPDVIMIVMGCFVQSTQLALPEANIILGTDQKSQVVNYLKKYLADHQDHNYKNDISQFNQYDEMKLKGLTTHTRGFVKIQDGCENFCSYCAIPYVRGKIKSRDPQDVLTEISQLVEGGVKEIIISGINTGTYGQDLGNINLSGLINLIIDQVSDLYLLRVSSIELKEITIELLDTLARHQEKIAAHFHIPLQSGSDQTLKRMNRKYLTRQYQEVIDQIRTRFVDPAITTDCLAGFVGETEEEFEVTKKFIQTIGFAQMHIFPYSRRKNTPADLLKPHLPNSLIKSRALELIEIARQMSYQYRLKYLNTIQKVLFEQFKNGYWYGHTSNYLAVKCLGSELTEMTNLENQVLAVKIINVDEETCLATFLKG